MDDFDVEMFFFDDELEEDGLPSKELLLDELANYMYTNAELEDELLVYRFKERLRHFGGLGDSYGAGVFN